jgi:hypothetical protein
MHIVEQSIVVGAVEKSIVVGALERLKNLGFAIL